MKFLIWFFCFFCMAIVKMFIDETDIAFLIANSMFPDDWNRRALLAGIIAGIIAIALFSITWWCGKRLCRAWDSRKIAKHKVSNIPEDIKVDAVEPSSKSKLRYCKYCGGVIDTVTMKCSKCGKQFFHLRIDKSVLFRSVILILALSIGAFSMYRISQYQQQISQLETQITDLEDTVEDLEKQISDKNSKNKELLNENLELQEKVSFYDEHIVFVLDDGTKRYHKYDCVVFKYSDSSYWAYNIEAAEYRGYTACFVCD